MKATAASAALLAISAIVVVSIIMFKSDIDMPDEESIKNVGIKSINDTITIGDLVYSFKYIEKRASLFTGLTYVLIAIDVENTNQKKRNSFFDWNNSKLTVVLDENGNEYKLTSATAALSPSSVKCDPESPAKMRIEIECPIKSAKQITLKIRYNGIGSDKVMNVTIPTNLITEAK